MEDLDYKLSEAVENCKPRTVAKLLKQGANPNSYQAVSKAAEHGHLQILKALIEAGGAPDIAVDNTISKSPLEEAAKAGSIETIDYLLAHGADVNRKRAAALFKAIEYRHYDTAKHLVRAGANVNMRCVLHLERTPLSVTVESHNPSLESLSNLNMDWAFKVVRVRHGRTVWDPELPGTYTANMRRIATKKLLSDCNRATLDFAEFLIAHGAEVNPVVTGVNGPETLDLYGRAAGAGHDDMAELLAQSGAKIPEDLATEPPIDKGSNPIRQYNFDDIEEAIESEGITRRLPAKVLPEEIWASGNDYLVHDLSNVIVTIVPPQNIRQSVPHGLANIPQLVFPALVGPALQERLCICAGDVLLIDAPVEDDEEPWLLEYSVLETVNLGEKMAVFIEMATDWLPEIELEDESPSI